jgi:hypothetical protein
MTPLPHTEAWFAWRLTAPYRDGADGVERAGGERGHDQLLLDLLLLRWIRVHLPGEPSTRDPALTYKGSLRDMRATLRYFL